MLCIEAAAMGSLVLAIFFIGYDIALVSFLGRMG